MADIASPDTRDSRLGPADRALRHPEKAHKPDQVSGRKPSWIRVKAPMGKVYNETKRIVAEKKLATVCEEAGCPNIGECWQQRHATMMILGSVCTRACTFCNIATGKPPALDPHEPGALGRDFEHHGAFECFRGGLRARGSPPDPACCSRTPTTSNANRPCSINTPEA